MSFTIPDGIDPKVRRALQDIQGKIYKLEKARKGGGVSPQVVYQVVGGEKRAAGGGGGNVVEEYLGDYTIHGDLFVDGTIHGLVASAISDIDPTFADVTGSRSVGTTYQNTETTMKVVVISVKLSA